MLAYIMHGCFFLCVSNISWNWISFSHSGIFVLIFVPLDAIMDVDSLFIIVTVTVVAFPRAHKWRSPPLVPQYKNGLQGCPQIFSTVNASFCKWYMWFILYVDGKSLLVTSANYHCHGKNASSFWDSCQCLLVQRVTVSLSDDSFKLITTILHLALQMDLPDISRCDLLGNL